MQQLRTGSTAGRLQAVLALFCLMLAGNIASAGAWKFAVVCDSRGDGVITSTAWVNTNVLQAVARGITNDRAEFVLFAGDMIRGNYGSATTNLVYQYTQWSNAFSPVYTARIPVYPIRGNHEMNGDPDGSIYTSAFGSTVPNNGPAGEIGKTYSFSHKNALIIGLDQYQNPQRVNQAWLDSRLASNRLPHVFVFGHEPAVQVSHSDCLAYENASRDLFLKSITEAGCRIYFCGHDHFYNRARLIPRNGINIMQVVLGTCGAPYSIWDGIYGQNYGEENMASNCYYSTYTNGYVLVTVSNFNVKMEWKGSTNLTTWETYDTYGYQITNPAIRNVNDYDGDSRTDPAVYSEDQGMMIVAMSARNYFCFALPVGGLGALLAPGDYDGDGLTDLAVYRKNSGLWQISLSDHNYATATNTLGGAGYAPVPTDYDGDGKTDLAAYQKSSGNWQIVFSSNGLSISGGWGGPGYQPVPSDYDGDGRADIVVYRESTGDWQALLSAGQELGHYVPYSFSWGGPDYFPACADYDNDGRTDLAVYDRLTGDLLAALSGSNYRTVLVPMNETNCVPVIADYDGDRKFDPMLYLEANAYWLGALSSVGYQMGAAYFGGDGWAAIQNEWRNDLVFLAFGDSITYGGGSSSDSPATAYPILLEDKLKQNYIGHFISINAGNPGETTEEGLERFPFWLDTNNPDLVLLMEGTNDSFFGDPYDQIEDNLRAMVQMALARGINVIIATIPPVISNSYRNRDEQQRRIVEFNPRIYQIAADYNIPVAAVYESITAVPNWQNVLMDQPSANHPNDAGHTVIRDTFYAPVSSGLDSGAYY
ncbi:MAG: GDSL-type esterase/lipase family protein [Kiritimatiellia bacterium]|nr:GDSL-type esterase/lipase family protein [Kiritimatiellia bacterium]